MAEESSDTGGSTSPLVSDVGTRYFGIRSVDCIHFLLHKKYVNIHDGNANGFFLLRQEYVQIISVCVSFLTF